MSKAKRLRELEAENVSQKRTIETLKKQIKEMQSKSKRTIGNSATYKEEKELRGDENSE